VSASDAISLRLAALERTLELAHGAIPVVTELDPALAGRLTDVLAKRTAEVTAGLTDAAQGDSTERTRRLTAGQNLIEETLAFLGAAAARKIGLDQGITTLAMSWLDQLSAALDLPPVAVVIPATTEVTGMTSSVVRLRIPSDGVWGLPVAVHEYGHFVAAHLTRRQQVENVTRTVMPVEDLLHGAGTKHGTDTEDSRPVLYWHGHELFADAFAAATAGPAYTHYCLRYRFLPTDKATATHPSSARRVRIQLAVLDALAGADDTGYLSAELTDLRARWTGDLANAEVPPDIPADSDLDRLERDIVSLALGDATLKRIHYGDHLSAYALAEAGLHDDRQPSAVHVINAAWRARCLAERRTDDPAEVDCMISSLSDAAYALLERATAHG
jgi:hypothetical protein